MTTAPYGSFLGTGWAFPPAFTKGGEEVVLVQNEQDIFESLQILLGTSLGERVMREDYGCNLRDYLFEELDQRLLSNLRLAVMNAIRNHESRIEAEAVEFDIEADFQQSIIHIHLHFRVRATNARYNLVYPFYLTESVAATGGNAVLPDYSRDSDLLLPEAPKPKDKIKDDEGKNVRFESFQHVSSAQSTNNNTWPYTMLDHPLLNDKPNAIIFVSPVYAISSDPPIDGTAHVNEYEVTYINNRWAIAFRNPSALMYENYAFDILIAPENTQNAFVHTVSEANRDLNMARTFLDHPLINKRPDAFLLVTPRKSIVSDLGVGVTYVPEKQQWALFHRLDVGENHENNLFAPDATFNILAMPSNNYGNLEAFDHTVTPENKVHQGTALPIEKTTGADDRFFYTVAKSGERGGIDFKGNLILWYDHPKDGWKGWKDGYWFIYPHGTSTPPGLLLMVAKVKT